MLTINKIIHKLDSSKIKNFCSPKDTIKRVERKAKEWEKIFAIHVSGKGLISRIYKEFLKIDLKEKKGIQPKEQWVRDLSISQNRTLKCPISK